MVHDPVPAVLGNPGRDRHDKGFFPGFGGLDPPGRFGMK